MDGLTPKFVLPELAFWATKVGQMEALFDEIEKVNAINPPTTATRDLIGRSISRAHELMKEIDDHHQASRSQQ